MSLFKYNLNSTRLENDIQNIDCMTWNWILNGLTPFVSFFESDFMIIILKKRSYLGFSLQKISLKLWYLFSKKFCNNVLDQLFIFFNFWFYNKEIKTSLCLKMQAK